MDRNEYRRFEIQSTANSCYSCATQSALIPPWKRLGRNEETSSLLLGRRAIVSTRGHCYPVKIRPRLSARYTFAVSTFGSLSEICLNSCLLPVYQSAVGTDRSIDRGHVRWRTRPSSRMRFWYKDSRRRPVTASAAVELVSLKRLSKDLSGSPTSNHVLSELGYRCSLLGLPSHRWRHAW